MASDHTKKAIGRRFRFRLFLLTTAALLPALCGTTGAISGIVQDKSGAGVGGAKITLTNTAMGIKSSTTTGKKGNYVFPLLLEGQYEMRAEAKGFKPQKRTGLVIHVDSKVVVDLTLDSDESATLDSSGAGNTGH